MRYINYTVRILIEFESRGTTKLHFDDIYLAIDRRLTRGELSSHMRSEKFAHNIGRCGSSKSTDGNYWVVEPKGMMKLSNEALWRIVKYVEKTDGMRKGVVYHAAVHELGKRV